MCGIAGYWSQSEKVDAAVARCMAEKIQHRGPDDSGVFLDEPAGVALAHQRLSILDLSPAGHQPMFSPCGRYCLVYNGEIYNHLDLRAVLETEGGHFDWKGHSDTETLLAALRHWGIDDTLKRLNGMFAFAFWDKRERRLYLARDRMGEKPLYYGHSKTTFLFGSELKALAEHPHWQGEIDREALTLYLRHGYIPAPLSIYTGIGKLLPAHYVVVAERGTMISKPICYWDLARIAETGSANPRTDPPEILVEELDILLRDSVLRRMASDVPLGAFLSGGYDSSTIVALMQAQTSRQVRTFSIGFHEKEYDEAGHARSVAEHLGTDHTELYVSPKDSIAIIPDLPRIWDEPFSDMSQIPTYLVSKLARNHVTVSLSGDGGDELFFGYQRYLTGLKFERLFAGVPRWIRQLSALCLRGVPVGFFDCLGRRLPSPLRNSSLGFRLRNLADILSISDVWAFYRRLVSHSKEPAKVVVGGIEPKTFLSDSSSWPTLPGLREQMMFLDSLTYLPDDILTKVDRASMAVSLEARVPLLDHRLVEFAWSIPSDLKYRNGFTKWILRQVLSRYVPDTLTDRPKKGFGVPIDHWLRGPLRDWAEELLNERRLLEQGYIHPYPIRQMWQEHLSGKRDFHYYLWDILMFQAWLEAEH